jgi:NitT/TauT family transport system substrate-binding protein
METRSSFIGRTAAAAASAIAVPTIISAAPAIPLKVSAFPIDPEGVIFYAKDLGYFDDAGLDITFFPSGGGGAQALAAIVSGDLDIGVTDPTIVAAAHLHGVGFRYIAPAAIATPETRTDTILVQADSKILKAADLNGKTIGTVSIKGLQQLIGMAWVDKHGGDSKTLKFLPLGFSEMLPALQQGRVDAVLTTEPFVEAAKTFARPMGNVFDGIANRFLVLGFFSTDDWLAKHADVATRFATALKRAAVWAKSHQSDSAKILLKYSKLDPAIAMTMPRTVYGETMDASLVQPVIDASVKYGILDKSFPASEIVWQAGQK